MFSKSLFIHVVAVSGFVTFGKRQVSLANNLISQYLMTEVILLIKTRNNNGPNTEP